MSDHNCLLYRLERFDKDGVARYLLFRKADNYIPVTASLYEAYLFSRRKPKKGTAGTVLQHVAYIFSWAERKGYDLEVFLLSGVGVQYPDISDFVFWLEDLRCRGNSLSSGYVSSIISSCKNFVIWFVKRYMKSVPGEPLNLTIGRVLVSHEKAWKDNGIEVVDDFFAKDFPESHVDKITDKFSQGGVALTDLSNIDLRNYVMWCLAVEFGLRIGEILALRTIDIHLTGRHQFVDIVRLDARSPSERDPRSPYQPKVKTKSRELGFLEKKSILPEAISIYQERHRTREIVRDGRKTLTPFLTHDFLLISHDGSGMPLSYSTAQKVIKKICAEFSCCFSWHSARHYFFNKYYRLATKSESDQVISIDNLVYYGGWANSESLKIYSNHARAENARAGLVIRNKKQDEERSDD